MKIPFSPPYIDESVIDEVIDTLKSGWITSGPKVNLLEKELCNFTSSRASICVNSWSSGALLVLKWFGIKEGDEVIIPAFTYAATALAVIQCGGKPIMVDVTGDFTIDVALIEDKITSKTKVIIPVDIAGWPCDYDKIMELACKDSIKRKFIASSDKQKKLGRILVMADAAHSIGSTYKGKQSGNLTDITVFSFHAVKNITTAEGGAVCLNLPEQFNIQEEFHFMKLLSLNGQTKDAFSKSKAGNWKYDILFPGFKINMPDICAAIGLAQIRKYKTDLLVQREKIANSYSDFFKKYDNFELPPQKDNDRTSCNHLYALRIKNISEIQRDKIVDWISSQGVPVNVHFIPLPLLTVFKNLGYNIADYPISYDNFSREISLPIYPQLQEGQIEHICNIVVNAYNKVIIYDKNN